MIKILDPNQNYLRFIEPVILNSFQDLTLRKNEMLNQACPEGILNQVQNDTFRVHDTCVRIQKKHFDDLDLELGIYLGFGI